MLIRIRSIGRVCVLNGTSFGLNRGLICLNFFFFFSKELALTVLFFFFF